MSGMKGSMVNLFEGAVKKASNGKDDALGFMLKLAAGRAKTCPFEEGSLAEARPQSGSWQVLGKRRTWWPAARSST